ncbi:hypothetical protein [Burkholderia cenocepacia]|nr:hypothetical protein [Burkholderia cenocepacia]
MSTIQPLEGNSHVEPTVVVVTGVSSGIVHAARPAANRVPAQR